MDKILTGLMILAVIGLCFVGVRWYILTHMKLGLETEFYSEAIKYLKGINDADK